MRVRRRDVGELVTRVKAILADAGNKRIRLPEISRAVGVSPSHLATTFKKAERTTIHRYLVNLRLNRAASLLPASDDLTDLALNLGFASQSHFTNAFRRWAGCTPGTFRSRRRQAIVPGEHFQAFRGDYL
jgi:AraC-like DNA-binding protein